jgi:hypothetical protein
MASASDVYWQFASVIYEPPLSEMRDNGSITDLSNPLAVVMLVVDFETEVSMNGITNFIGNSTGRYARETVDAMRALGCPAHADLLSQMLDVADAAGMTFDAIQRDRRGQQQFAVSSFAETHGDKWDAATEAIYQIEDSFDSNELVARAEQYVGEHLPAFEAALASASGT